MTVALSLARQGLSALLDRLQAPDWVRRCVGQGHQMQYAMCASRTEVSERWTCATCGKDRP